MENRSFNWRIIDQIDQLIDGSGLTRAEVIARSGMRRNTFFVKMRGETALTTDDISKIADALNVEPEMVFIRASANVDGRQKNYGLAANDSINEFPDGSDADHDGGA